MHWLLYPEHQAGRGPTPARASGDLCNHLLLSERLSRFLTGVCVWGWEGRWAVLLFVCLCVCVCFPFSTNVRSFAMLFPRIVFFFVHACMSCILVFPSPLSPSLFLLPPSPFLPPLFFFINISLYVQHVHMYEYEGQVI